MTGKQGREAYIARVSRGEGFMPWQKKERTSPEEQAFREATERRKDEMLARRVRVAHPVMLTEEQVAQARRNIGKRAWTKAWLKGVHEIADYAVSQPSGYVEEMIPELTPTNPYGLTCPRCVGKKSQEGMGYRTSEWDYRHPEVIRCTACGQTYPNPRYPETGSLVCPRRGQTFTFYVNDEERRHPRDRSGRYAWKWVGKPVHSSFSGFVRGRKILFMTSALKSLALVYRFTDDLRYAERAVRILERLAHCYRHWLYHDFYDTIADCDPLYAAWHDRELKLVWKRHLCGMAYGGVTYETGSVDDTVNRAQMLATYFGCGRIHPSTDAIESCMGPICLAYDLTYNARRTDGKPLWTEELRRQVEKDLILEYLMTAEPFVGGTGKPPDLGNKSPFVYHAQAVVGKCLGLPEYASAALRGYEALRDHSFLFDGFTRESPAYTNLYLANVIWTPETLHGFRWPKGFSGQVGKVDVYRNDPKLRRILQTALDQLRPDGRYLPLSDTMEYAAPSVHVFEIGLKRYLDVFSGRLPGLYCGRRPTEYALFHLDARDLERDTGLGLPETLFPAWMTAVLRHGEEPDASVLALPFNPPGGHRQPDNLSLYYVDRGRTMLGELGYVGDSPVDRWVRGTTFSHNLVIVDDQEQRFREKGKLREPSLRLMATSPRVSVVEASSRVYAQCSDYRRLVALIKGPDAQTFALDIFRVKGGQKHAYRLFSELASSDAREGALEFTNLDMPSEKPLPNFKSSVEPEHIFGLRDTRRVEDPPSSWQAVWKEQGRSYRPYVSSSFEAERPGRRDGGEQGRSYRLHVLSQVDAVETSNGPGQEMGEQIGRRVRYLDAVRGGEGLSSTFVTLHEPSGPRRSMPIRKAVRLDVPAQAGPDAVAVRIVSKWGTYLVFSEFEKEAEVAGVRFQGTFGTVCRTSNGRRWLLSCGAGALLWDEFGFEKVPASWSGKIVRHTEETLITGENRPAHWPGVPEEVKAYVLVGSERGYTGFPVGSMGKRRIEVERFPLQPAEQFVLPAVQWREE